MKMFQTGQKIIIIYLISLQMVFRNRILVSEVNGCIKQHLNLQSEMGKRLWSIGEGGGGGKNEAGCDMEYHY